MLAVQNCLLLIILAAHSQNSIRGSKSLFKDIAKNDDFPRPGTFIQPTATADDYIQKIDSIGRSSGIPSHFGRIYRRALENLATGALEMDSATEHFIKRFENAFAASFLDACADNENGNLSPDSEWKFLFSHPEARGWQLVLLGVNVHVNIDFSQAMFNNFSEEELIRHKRQLLACKSSIAKVYSEFFDSLTTDSRYLKFVNDFTNGLAKKLGEKLIYKWRRRNINLGVLYYRNPEKFRRRMAVVKRKKQHIDRFILRERRFAFYAR